MSCARFSRYAHAEHPFIFQALHFYSPVYLMVDHVISGGFSFVAVASGVLIKDLSLHPAFLHYDNVCSWKSLYTSI